MAESIRLKVACHACGNIITGTARYGFGHYVPEGVDFEFIAIGKMKDASGSRVKAEVLCICPRCGVKCKYLI
jgi:hypothetical protein